MPDARWNDPREYDDPERGDDRPRVYSERDRDDHDPRDSLIHDLDLPRGEERELVVDRDRVDELNVSVISHQSRGAHAWQLSRSAALRTPGRSPT